MFVYFFSATHSQSPESLDKKYEGERTPDLITQPIQETKYFEVEAAPPEIPIPNDSLLW